MSNRLIEENQRLVLRLAEKNSCADLMREEFERIENALDDPRLDVTHSIPELITEMKQQLAAKDAELEQAWRERNEAVAKQVNDLETSQAQLTANRQRAREMSALTQYTAAMEGELEGDPVERLRFFLSLALTGQDWLDVEQFIDGVSQQLAEEQADALEQARIVGMGGEREIALRQQVALLRASVTELRQQLSEASEHIDYLILRDKAWADIDSMKEQQLAARDTEVKLLRDAANGALRWDRNRDYIMPYRVRDPLIAALAPKIATTPKEPKL